jgi:cytochrome b
MSAVEHVASPDSEQLAPGAVPSTLIEYRVWDRAQRVFHWINFLAVLALAGIGGTILASDALGIPDRPGMVLLKTAHVYVGYVFVVNLVWRLVWAFIGGRFARWSALLPVGRDYGARLVSFVHGLATGRTPFYLGHNPVARIVLSLLLLSLVVQAATGIVLAGTDVYLPPLGSAMREWVAADSHDAALVLPYSPETVNAGAYAEMRAFRAPIVTTHELNFYVLLVLIAVHIAAAVATEIRERGNVISAMFTGRKVHDQPPVDMQP